MERLTRQQRQQLTRERLLDAAARLFAERGLTASLDEVAAAAGLTKGAVYSNFASKEELLLALIKRRTTCQRSGHENFVALTERSIPLPQRLQALATAFDTGMTDESNRSFMLFMVEFWTSAMRNPRMLDAFTVALRELRAGIAEHLSDSLAASELPLPPDEFAVLALALDIGFLIQHMADPQAVPGRHYSSAAKLIFGSTIADRPTPEGTTAEQAAAEQTADQQAVAEHSADQQAAAEQTAARQASPPEAAPEQA